MKDKAADRKPSGKIALNPVLQARFDKFLSDWIDLCGSMNERQRKTVLRIYEHQVKNVLVSAKSAKKKRRRR